MKQVSYRRAADELVVDDGTQFEHDESGEGFVASLSDALEVSLTSLRAALGRFAANHGVERARLLVVDMPRSRLQDDVLFDPIELVWDEGEMRIGKDFVQVDEPPPDEQLAARMRPLLNPRRRIAGISKYLDDEIWIVTIEVAVDTRAQTVGSAVELAHQLDMLIWASTTDMAGVASLVRAGQACLLIGSYESNWLEVKSAPYRERPEDELELAKDVAALANSGGGVLLIGLKTKRDPEGDRIRAVNECALSPGIAKRYRRVIARHIYPSVELLAIEVVPGTDAEHGVIMIEVPLQPSGSKPFLVHGIVRDARVEGAYFGLPVRSEADTDFLDIRILHSRLRAGTSFLAGDVAMPPNELPERVQDVPT